MGEVARLSKWYYTTETMSNLVFSARVPNCGNLIMQQSASIVQKISDVGRGRLFHCRFYCRQPTWLSVTFLFEVKPEKPVRQWDFQHLSLISLRWSYFLILSTCFISSFSGMFWAVQSSQTTPLLTCHRVSYASLRRLWRSHQPFFSSLSPGTSAESELIAPQS